eukprot:CAMPEP_0114421518 /NCGR_PEP_ID=MMETSP0103-20121206/5119_1 /TAXON_ID=37642 ORGANISM="Paraphysomonas imperforata, Strain PA2" /NCGR_SAMPLE_ID=MMETSP0103 /ASSEMBLY_ACC=CAM_ASM_000201 /LENGTH=841 /DNA_ID=CAMNT_0001590041 /DNA_START=55 /DNA_END=2580 /DNA_ORIENTATION=-
MEFRFGMAGELSVELTTVAFCGTVLFLNIFDGMTNLLEKSVGSSPIYNTMIKRIYHELMSTGFVSVMLSFYQAAQNSSEKRNRVLTTLDFCGYFIFCVAIFHVTHGIYIIIKSLSSTKQYDKYHRTSVSSEILKEWKEMHHNPTFMTKVKIYLMSYLYIPGFTLRSKAEFKIFYSLFRHTYMLPKHFHYGKYLSGCFERYSLKIVTIGTTGWVCMVVLCVANMVRVKFGNIYTWRCGSFEESEHVDVDDTEEYHRPRLSNRCQRIQLQLFFGWGLIINAFVLLIYVLGRMYTLRLLAEAGVTELNDFEAYLTLEEKIKQEKKKVLAVSNKEGDNKTSGVVVHRHTINMDTFKKNIEAKRQNSTGDESGRNSPMMGTDSRKSPHIGMERQRSRTFGDAVTTVLNTVSSKIIHREDDDKEKDEDISNAEYVNLDDTDADTEAGMSLNRRTAVVKPNPSDSEQPRQTKRRRNRGTVRKNRGTMNTSRKSMLNRHSGIGRVGGMAQSEVSVSKSCIAQFRTMKMKAQIAAQLQRGRSGSKAKKIKSMLRNKARSFTAVQPANGEESANLKVSEDFSFIYLFGSPLLYFRAVETCIALNSLYLSFWVLNFITVAHSMTNNDENNDHWPEWIWQAILIGPLLFSVPVIGEIVKTASLLGAIAELEIDVMGIIIEGMEMKKSLSDGVRSSILEGFLNTFQQECSIETLRPLFDAHDQQQRGFLSFDHMRNLLINLNLHISDERFESLIDVLDFNRDGCVSFEELSSFVFGDTSSMRIASEETYDDDIKSSVESGSAIKGAGDDQSGGDCVELFSLKEHDGQDNETSSRRINDEMKTVIADEKQSSDVE